MRRRFAIPIEGFRSTSRSSPGLSRKEIGIMSAQGGDGAPSGSMAPSPLYPNTNAKNGDAGGIGDKPGPLEGDGHEGIPLGLSKLAREELEVGDGS